MRAALLGVTTIAVIVTLSGGATGASARQPAGQPELLEALSTGEMPTEEALAALDRQTRADFTARVAIRAGYVSPRPVPQPTGSDMDGVDEKRRFLEGYLVACAGRQEVAPTAARYASTAVLAYEWEGYSEGPLAEAEHAEAYLRRYPRSVLRGGLELFLLVRYRAAFEAADSSDQHDAQRRAAAGYRAVWARQRASHDPVIAAVARDIDAAQQVYMRSERHPRTFGR